MILNKYAHPDGVVAYQVDFDGDTCWFRFETPLRDEEEQLLAVTAQVGTLATVRALELPFWDVPSTGGQTSWYCHR